MTGAAKFPTETTPEGEQFVALGVQPISLRERLEWRARQPVGPKRNPGVRQESCDIGLFDEAARKQLDILEFLRAAERGASIPPRLKE